MQSYHWIEPEACLDDSNTRIDNLPRSTHVVTPILKKKNPEIKIRQ